MSCECHGAYDLFRTDASNIDDDEFWGLKFEYHWEDKMRSLAAKAKGLELPSWKIKKLERLESGVAAWQCSHGKRECFADLGIVLHNPKKVNPACWYVQIVCKRCRLATCNLHILASEDPDHFGDFGKFISILETYVGEWTTTGLPSTPALKPLPDSSPSMSQLSTQAPSASSAILSPRSSMSIGGSPSTARTRPVVLTPRGLARQPGSRKYCRYAALRHQRTVDIDMTAVTDSDNNRQWHDSDSNNWWHVTADTEMGPYDDWDDAGAAWGWENNCWHNSDDNRLYNSGDNWW